MKRIVWSLIAAILTLGLADSATAQTVREITMLNLNFEGNNVWVPNTIIVKKGERVRLKLFNRAKPDPPEHGFAIPDFGVKLEVKRGTTETVEFVADKAGLFRTECQLHAAHFPGVLLVVE